MTCKLYSITAILIGYKQIKALASELKEQYDYLMSKPDSDIENKNCEKYSQVSVKCVNNTAGGSNIIKVNHACNSDAIAAKL